MGGGVGLFWSGNEVGVVSDHRYLLAASPDLPMTIQIILNG